ncbi:MAG: hypothetical protein ACI9MS_002393 [Glaciecola sp.]
MLNIKSIIVCFFFSLFITACTSNSEVESNSYYGKWTLNKVVDEDGDFNDFSREPGNYVHIKKSEVSEIIAGHGVRTYPYTQKGNVFTVTSGTRDVIWTIVESTEHSMKIDTPIGRYILTRD